MARALQAMEQANHADIFTSFLREKADDVKDYAALEEATVGLRDSYLNQPVTVAVGALQDPRREVRLAATLALTEHRDAHRAAELLDRAANDADPRVQIAARRAQWAMSVVQRADTVREAAHLALAQGDIRHASQLLDQVAPQDLGWGDAGGNGYQLALKMGLSARKPPTRTSGGEGIIMFSGDWSDYILDAAFSPKLDRFQLLRREINLKATGGLVWDMQNLTSLLSQNLELRESIREDPNFAPLRQVYWFRVLTGMQEPITVENIKLPQPNPQSPEASAENSK